ncbi:MAG: hypothetical protein ACOX0K_08370 [Oscillospiraceae bacterium]|jgi:hypothetical protein
MFRKQRQKLAAVKLGDLGAVGVFAAAIALLVVVGLYVVARLAGERAYREKWKDYVDCGWA